MPDSLSLTQNKLSPTDFSQYLRLDRCERYLRLRMVEREHKTGFLDDFGVSPQEPPKVLAAAGDLFEAEVFRELREKNRVLPSMEEAQATLNPGESAIILQPRLEATLGNWKITGVGRVRVPEGQRDRRSRLSNSSA